MSDVDALAAVHADDPTDSQFEAAAQRLRERRLASAASRSVGKETANAENRKFIEVCEMLARVRREVAASGRGWTWHLLSVLDWDNLDIERNESEGVRLSLLPSDEPRQSRDEIDASVAGRIARLEALNKAVAAALPDLEYCAGRYHEHARFQAALDSFGVVLRFALEDVHQVRLGLKEISSIHPRVRRFEHIRAAALELLMDLHTINGHAPLVRLSTFIEEQNDHLRPRPCPQFARDTVYDKVKTSLSRGRA